MWSRRLPACLSCLTITTSTREQEQARAQSPQMGNLVYGGQQTSSYSPSPTNNNNRLRCECWRQWWWCWVTTTTTLCCGPFWRHESYSNTVTVSPQFQSHLLHSHYLFHSLSSAALHHCFLISKINWRPLGNIFIVSDWNRQLLCSGVFWPEEKKRRRWSCASRKFQSQKRAAGIKSMEWMGSLRTNRIEGRERRWTIEGRDVLEFQQRNSLRMEKKKKKEGRMLRNEGELALVVNILPLLGLYGKNWLLFLTLVLDGIRQTNKLKWVRQF